MNWRHPNLANGLISGLLAGVLLASATAWPDGARANDPAPYPEPPQDLFKDLFVAVQLAPIFADGKAFPDAAPNAAPEDILAQYHAAHPDSPQALEEFVDSHFAIPAPAAVVSPPSDHTPLVAHIDALWTQLTRRSPVAPSHGSLLALPRRYVVPGGRFREIYYWDSYFTMLGLQQSGRQDLVADMIGDFAYLIDTYGHIPNGARTYYLSRSQPPLFFAMVGLSSPADPAKAYARYLPELKREYAFWMEGARRLRPGTAYRHAVALSDGAILNRYWDDRDTPRDESFREDTELGRTSGRPPAQLYRDIRAAAESGWDFSSRWFADAQNRATIDTTSLVPIDLNSLLFGLENAIRLGCGAAHDSACAREFAAHARSRHAAIDRYLWDASRGAYLDYDWPHRTPRPLVSAATLYPLFVDLASAAQAAAVAKTIAGTLLEAGGVVTTTQNTGQQWDAPNGWAPLQWIAISGLRRYGQTALAADIACRWMANVATVYRNTGKLVEKYDVVDTGRRGGGGEYPTQDGFGWTNGVMRKLAVEYPQYLSDSTPTRCSDSP